LLLLLFVAGAVWFAFTIGAVVRMVIIASILAYILNPLVNMVEARGAGRTFATVTVFMGILLLTFYFVLLLLPVIMNEIQSARESLVSGHTSDRLNRIKDYIELKLSFLGMQDLNLMDRARTYLLKVGEKTFGYLLNAFSLLTNMIIIPFISFFMVKDSREIKRQFIRLVPNKFFEFTLNLLHKMDMQLGNYIRGQLLESSIIALLSIGALWLLGVDYFIIFGAFAGVANLVPYVGPIVGVIPPVIVSLYETGNLAAAGYIVFAFLIIQLIDNGVLKPVVVGKSVDLHPLVILLAVIIGGKFFGILGMILSIPFTGFLKIIMHESMINFRKYRFS